MAAVLADSSEHCMLAARYVILVMLQYLSLVPRHWTEMLTEILRLSLP